MLAEQESLENVKDRTKMVWGGIVLLFVAMVFGLWFMGRPDPNISTVTIKHILITYDKADVTDRNRALEMISDLRKRILAGEDFGVIAKEYSDEESSGRRGGHLGSYQSGKLEKSIETYAWSAPVGELSDVLSTSYGFHLVVVTDRHITKADRYQKEMNEKAQELLDKQMEEKDPS